MRGTFIFPGCSVFCQTAFTHRGVANDERGTSFLLFSLTQRLADEVRMVAGYLLYIPAPGFVFSGNIFRGHLFTTCRELDIVAVVEHDEVVQSQVSGQTSCALRYLFLHTAVRDKSVDSRIMHSAITGVEPFSRYCRTNGIGVTLTQRTRSVLNAASDVTLRMTGRWTAPLTQLLQLVHGVETGQA